jgi:hypothetical protein
MPPAKVKKRPTAHADVVHPMIERVRADFMEMPGLRLTTAQAHRLFGVDEAVCQHVLDTLVASHVLRRNRDSTYSRLIE